MPRIAAQFEGDFKLSYHLAPPLLAKTNDKGELQKQKFGPWVQTAFRLLAPLKFLRGTAFDVFGRTEERRTERALVGEYRASLTPLLGRTERREPCQCGRHRPCARADQGLWPCESAPPESGPRQVGGVAGGLRPGSQTGLASQISKSAASCGPMVSRKNRIWLTACTANRMPEALARRTPRRSSSGLGAWQLMQMVW